LILRRRLANERVGFQHVKRLNEFADARRGILDLALSETTETRILRLNGGFDTIPPAHGAGFIEREQTNTSGCRAV